MCVVPKHCSTAQCQVSLYVSCIQYMSAIILFIVRCSVMVAWFGTESSVCIHRICTEKYTACECTYVVVVCTYVLGVFLAFPERANYIRAVSICDSHSFLVPSHFVHRCQLHDTCRCTCNDHLDLSAGGRVNVHVHLVPDWHSFESEANLYSLKNTFNFHAKY